MPLKLPRPDIVEKSSIDIRTSTGIEYTESLNGKLTAVITGVLEERNFSDLTLALGSLTRGDFRWSGRRLGNFCLVARKTSTKILS